MLVLWIIISASCQEKIRDEKHSYVNDEVNLLTDDERENLANELKELESAVGSQMVILVIDSLAGENIEEYSLEVANAWGIGREGYDDGVLITVVLKKRRMRIEVGRGLEKIITNEMADRIIREKIAPRFRDERYYEGLLSGVQEMKLKIKQNKNLIGLRP